MVYNMENAEEVMQILERYTRLKQKEIPKELDEYLQYVAKTGDTVFKWSSLKYLFREKLLNVIKNFHDTSSTRGDEIPQYPNVDPFNYESMKSALLERLELFNAAPFTIQRLCELLIDPHKQYSRIDKFMRALEKNILVSTIEPGRKRTESENGDSLDSVVNGDLSLDVNVDIDMENETIFNTETQNGNGPTTTNVKPESETIETKVGAENTEIDSNALRSADDDILPNPKKLKLDIDEKEKESEKDSAVKSSELNTESKSEQKLDDKIDEQKPDIIKSNENDNENVTNDTNEINDSNNDAEMSEDKQNIDIETETEKIENSGKISENKEEVNNEKEQNEKEKNDNEKTEDSSEEKISDKLVENVKSIIDQVDNNGDKTEQETENNTVNEEEKIIEKQEIEKCEKEELSTTPPTDVEVSKTTDKEVEDAKEEGTTEAITAAEEPTTEAKQNNVESGTKIVEESTTPVDTEEAAVEKVEKVDTDKNETCDVDDKKEVESVIDTGEKETLAPTNEDGKTEEENVNKEIETESPTAITIESTVVPTVDVEAKVTEQLPVIAEDTDDKVIVEAVPTTEEIKTVDNSETVENSKTDNIVVTPPTITLNDQPMEDSSVDDGSPVPEVNMVVESSDSATAMATDSTQPNNKDDPAKMEVDETSQEAMDQ
ncbi:serine/threonine-protein phosphatase 4 regulatory subunit 2 isoform X2 [Teleopsis dalmanni]|uniref:serine/threonine-protein phosphatase 4 regulatory subunit 2 isoform X2 n=1 Tax=Teleopsis dalmanni TaxID=139649 RepID=UPI0018CDD871|nr:serine/threonine-protein phosphatase 4 regulatory subunit 2 isoform X2 [Teleopsis dalmanni]